MKAGRKPITAQTKKGADSMQKLDGMSVRLIEHELRTALQSAEKAMVANEIYHIPQATLQIAQYVYDHNHGRPKARIEAEVEQKIDADKLLALKRRMLEIEREETVKLAQYSILEEIDERNTFRPG